LTITTGLVGKGRWRLVNPKWKLFDRLNRKVPVSQEEVPKGEQGRVTELISRGVLMKKRPKGNRKFKIFVSNWELFELVLDNEFPDGLDSVHFENDSRESAAKRSRDSKGTTVKVDSSILIKVFSRPQHDHGTLSEMTERHGVVGLDLQVTDFHAQGLWVSVENHESFFACNSQNCPDLDGVILLSGNPSRIKIDWMEESAKKGCNFIHFADLDFFGLEHFAAIHDRLDKAVTLWNSPEIGAGFYINKGDSSLFTKQKLEANLDRIGVVLPKDENANTIFTFITETGMCIHQEMVHDLFFKSRCD